MAIFGASFQRNKDSESPNNVGGDITDSSRGANCRVLAHDFDDDLVDDLVDDPDDITCEDDGIARLTDATESLHLKTYPGCSKPLSSVFDPSRISAPLGLRPKSSKRPGVATNHSSRGQRYGRDRRNTSHQFSESTTSLKPQANDDLAAYSPSASTLVPRASSATDRASGDRDGNVVDDQFDRPRKILFRSWSAEQREKQEAEDEIRRRISRLSQMSVFSGFETHPSIRPLENHEKFGEPAPPPTDDDTDYPAPLALALIVIGVCMSVFVISLDRNIITTAIPKITARFGSYDDIGWYGSAYLLTASAFQPLYGRIYTSFETKTSFLGALAVFEVGSIIGALAPSSPVLIIGRAVQGLGSAGILTGAFVVCTHSVRMKTRPILFAGVGILYAVGALCGPLMGGAFTDTIGWRWCFWVNLPIGGFTFFAVLLCFKTRHFDKGHQSFFSRILTLDLFGNVILISGLAMLFLALQYSEQRYSWSSARVVGLLVGFGVTTVIFIAWMLYRGDNALLPPKIMSQRTVAASCGAAFFIYGTTLLHAYYLPIWFQAIKNDSALKSGVNMLPYVAANAVFNMVAGVFVSKSGLFAPPAIVGCAIGTVGCGMLATLKPDSPTAAWAGFEILISVGIGAAIQQGFSAVQTALPMEQVPIGTAAVVASQSCGGAIFVALGNTLLQNHLLSEQNAGRIPGVNVRAIFEMGATAFRDHVPPEAIPELVLLYNKSLQGVFIAAVPLCGMAFLCSLCMEWKSVKNDQKKMGDSET